MKKVLAVFLVVFWCGLIFSFSSNNKDESSSLTKEVITRTVSFFTNIDRDSKEMDKIVKSAFVPVRKCAHFFMYFCLAFLIMNVLYLFGIKKHTLIITSIICIIFAASDEFHQLFVDGRSGSAIDVLLDSSAALFCSFIYHKFVIMRVYYEKTE